MWNVEEISTDVKFVSKNKYINAELKYNEEQLKVCRNIREINVF